MPVDADDAIVRRLVDAAVFSELLGRETAVACATRLNAESAVVFVRPAGAATSGLIAWSGCDAEAAQDACADGGPGPGDRSRAGS